MALINVAKANVLCPICNKPDWCMISEDGKLSLCQRIKNKHPNKKGGWWHSLEKNITYNKVPFQSERIKKKAPDYILNVIYSSILDKFPINKKHIQDLATRGISKEELNYFGYKSLPIKGRYLVMKSLSKLYDEKLLKLTPGIYTKEGKYGPYLTISGGTGFMIPILNFHNEICGIQVRVDQPTDDTKYIWLSSTDKKDGTNSGTPVHVAIPPKIKRNEIWITEGPLKSNVLAWRRECIVVAASGISNWTEIPNVINNIRLIYSIDGPCVIAYDADYRSNQQVKEHAKNLCTELRKENNIVRFAIWNINDGKGIDDLVVKKGIAHIVEDI